MLTISEPALHALGVFGLTTDDVGVAADGREGRAAAGAAELDTRLGPGGIALVTGPSGAGKSSLMRALRARLAAGGRALVDANEELRGAMDAAHRRGSRVIDLLAPSARDVARALRALSAAGLADAFVPVARVCDLSDGQRARLAVVLAVRRCEGLIARGGWPVTILIDELASTLDDATAESLCRAIRRWAGSGVGVRVVGATARSGVGGWLKPDLVAGVREDGDACIRPAPDGGVGIGAGTAGVRIAPGWWADYRALAHLHYRAGKPAACVRVLAARAPGEAGPVGVLTVSMPTLNGSWRERAWPGEYSQRKGRRESAARLNRDVRCISRLIVEPRWRGRGVGATLVRAYLREPLTGRTEAVSAMGAGCPVFARAGMREWMTGPAVRDERLVRNIEAAGLRAWMIADVDEAMDGAARHPFLEAAFRTWARAHGPTRALADGDLRAVIRAAARTIVHRPLAYTAG